MLFFQRQFQTLFIQLMNKTEKVRFFNFAKSKLFKVLWHPTTKKIEIERC